MSYRTRQILRTRYPEIAEGQVVPPNTRVVVLSMARGRLRTAIVDSQYPALYRKRLEAKPAAFAKVVRGRPRRQSASP